MGENTLKLLIVGAGITGSVIAFELKRLFAEAFSAGKMSVSIWDKARGPGGRMTTSRHKLNPKCHADIGAQYISSTSSDINKFHRLYDELRRKGLLVDMTATVEGDNQYGGPDVLNMIAPQGMSSLVKHFLNSSEVSYVMEREVHQIIQNSDGKLLVSTTGGQGEEFDGVILTMPVPQILKLQGNFYDPPLYSQLQKRDIIYSSRFTLVLFFPNQADIGFNFGFKYVDGDEIIRYVAVDNIKRGTPSEPAALVAHSTWQFGQEHLDENKEQVENLLVDRLYQLFPNLPATSSRKIHKWRYGQVRSKSGQKEENAPFFLLKDSPVVVCAGDGFSTSSLDGCFQSATATTLFLQDTYRAALMA